MIRWRKTLGALVVAVAACTPFAFATGNPKAGEQSIEVFVKKVQAGSARAEYHYTVTNRSTFAIHTLLVGHDEYYGGPRLSGYPVGWDGDTLPASSFRSPPGWRFAVQPYEEDSLIEITWAISSAGQAIRAGQSLGGFGVVLEQPDSTYDVGGLWTVYVMGDSPRFGALKRAK